MEQAGSSVEDSGDSGVSLLWPFVCLMKHITTIGNTSKYISELFYHSL